MGTRGRKSSAALAIRTPASLAVTDRPSAPDELSDEEAATWVAVINRMPADWFGPETLPLLLQYARHVTRARHVAEIIHGFETGMNKEGEPVAFEVETYDRLLKMQERESRAIASLATKMRIAQQSTIDKETKRKGVGRRLWEDES